jgi:hypothetical protein
MNFSLIFSLIFYVPIFFLFIHQINGQEVEWRFYQNLFKEDKKLPANLRLCPKLTENHINPTNTAKMRVSFATQVHDFSLRLFYQYVLHYSTASIKIPSIY